MTPEQLRISPDDLRELRRFRSERDEAARQLGVTIFEAMRAIRQLEKVVETSLAREVALTGQILQRHGIPAGVSVNIDHDTGRIAPID